MYAYCLNNPSNLLDANGQSSTVVGWWLLTEAVIAAAKAVGVGLVKAAAAAVTGAMVLSLTSSAAEEKVVAEAATVAKSEPPSGPYSVYFLCAVGDVSKTIIYVGRVKTANYESRMAYHRAKGREPVNRIDGLSYEACRGMEQAGMMYYHTINPNNDMYNQIRGISPSNKQRFSYLSAAFDFAHSDGYMGESGLPASYRDNVTENELLNVGS